MQTPHTVLEHDVIFSVLSQVYAAKIFHLMAPLRVKKSLVESSGGRGSRTQSRRPSSYQSLECQFEDGQSVGTNDKAIRRDIVEGWQSVRKCDSDVTTCCVDANPLHTEQRQQSTYCELFYPVENEYVDRLKQRNFIFIFKAAVG